MLEEVRIDVAVLQGGVGDVVVLVFLDLDLDARLLGEVLLDGFSLAKCGLLRGGRWPGCEAVLRSKASDCRGEAGDPTLIARREETHSEFDGFRERVRGLRLAVPQRWSTSRLSMSPMSWTIWTMTTMTTTMMMRTDHTLWLYP